MSLDKYAVHIDTHTQENGKIVCQQIDKMAIKLILHGAAGEAPHRYLNLNLPLLTVSYHN